MNGMFTQRGKYKGIESPQPSSWEFRMLCDKRWEVFVEPPSPDEEPEYWEAVKDPMDLATLLYRVDRKLYETAAAFVADIGLIPKVSRNAAQLEKRQRERNEKKRKK
eukprot:scaffold321741_cov26-Prasinocladus_malaysianus.AAC.3